MGELRLDASSFTAQPLVGLVASTSLILLLTLSPVEGHGATQNGLDTTVNSANEVRVDLYRVLGHSAEPATPRLAGSENSGSLPLPSKALKGRSVSTQAGYLYTFASHELSLIIAVSRNRSQLRIHNGALSITLILGKVLLPALSSNATPKAST
jgi:hypothetical protein